MTEQLPPTKIIQIKGSNGTGKTTLMKQLVALSEDKYYVRDPQTRKPYATVLYDLQWCLVGLYPEDKQMGGTDNIHTVAEMKAIIKELVECYPGYWIAAEGMMISTTMTIYNYMLELKQAGYNVEPCVVVLKSSVDGCIKRIEKRRGSPLERTDLVAQKCELVLRHQYKPGHALYIDVDNIAEEDMLPTFLKVVGDDLVYSYL